MNEHNTESTALSPNKTFIAHYLGPLLLAIPLISTILMLVPEQYFATSHFFSTITRQFIPYLILALAVALTARVGGPDLSLGSYLALSGIVAAPLFNQGNSGALAGVALSFAVCALIGALAGTIIQLIKLPRFLVSAVVTFLMGGGVRTLAYLQTRGMPTRLEVVVSLELIALYGLAIAAVLLVVGFVLAHKAPRAACVFAFGAAAGMAGMAGLYLMVRMTSAQPTIGSSETIVLLYIYAAVTASRLYARKPASIVVAIIVAVHYRLLSFALAAFNITAYWHPIVISVVALPQIVVSLYIHYREWRDAHPKTPVEYGETNAPI